MLFLRKTVGTPSGSGLKDVLSRDDAPRIVSSSEFTEPSVVCRRYNTGCGEDGTCGKMFVFKHIGNLIEEIGDSMLGASSLAIDDGEPPSFRCLLT